MKRTVPEGHVWLESDNLYLGEDSNRYDSVPIDCITVRSVWVFTPMKNYYWIAQRLWYRYLWRDPWEDRAISREQPPIGTKLASGNVTRFRYVSKGEYVDPDGWYAIQMRIKVLEEAKAAKEKQTRGAGRKGN